MENQQSERQIGGMNASAEVSKARKDCISLPWKKC